MRFVLMADLHYSRMKNGTEEMLEAREKVYSVILDRFLEFDAELHISLGDLTQEGHPEEFGYVLDRIGRSGRHFINVIGNHDAYSIPKTVIMSITGQQRYHSIDTEEAALIFLDTSNEMNRDLWGGDIDAEQLEWLQVQLENSGNKPVFVFAHHPVYGTTARSTMEKYSIHPQTGIRDALTKKKGLGFFFCGHNHMNSFVRQDGWHFIQTATCLKIPTFRVVECKEGRVKIHLISVDDKNLTGRIARFTAKMPGFTHGLEVQGEEEGGSLLIDTLKNGSALF